MNAQQQQTRKVMRLPLTWRRIYQCTDRQNCQSVKTRAQCTQARTRIKNAQALIEKTRTTQTIINKHANIMPYEPLYCTYWQHIHHPDQCPLYINAVTQHIICNNETRSSSTKCASFTFINTLQKVATRGFIRPNTPPSF